MQAWCIDEPGGPEVLKLREVDDLHLGPADVLVRVQAIGVNRADLLQRRGAYPAPPGFDARIPGLEYAGVIEQVGSRVQLRQVSERIMGITGGGAYAQHVLVHERETIAVPDNIEMLAAAAIPEVFLTAYRAIFLEAGLKPGEWCLVRPATAGVGIAALQLIRALGARSIGTSRSAERLDAVRRFGLDAAHVESEGDLGAAVREKTAGEGVAVLLDLLGGGYFAENTTVLRAEGTQVLVGCLAGRKDEIDLGQFLQRRLKLKAMTMRSLPIERKIAMARVFETRLTPLFAAGNLHAVVDRTVPFAEAPEAHRLMETNAHCGKIVIVVS